MIVTDIFSTDQQKDFLDHAIKLANDRYNNELNIHVDTPVSQLDIVAHSSNFLTIIEGIYNELHAYLENHDDKLKSEITNLDQSIKKFVVNFPLSSYDWEQTRNLAKAIQKKCFTIIKDIEKQKNLGDIPNSSWSKQQHYKKLIKISYRLDDIACKKNQDLYNQRIAILQGDGGIGKTHLLCDYATQRLANNLPTFLFLSDDLLGRDPIIAIAKKFCFKRKKLS